jgi:hypothetical protein
VFYDGPEGQARVLGGGFIERTASAGGARGSGCHRCAPAHKGGERRPPRPSAEHAWGRISTSGTSRSAYARWAPVYDPVFGAVFEKGRRARSRRRAAMRGRRAAMLEVGVGTGISLPDFSQPSRLVGVDISEPMLRKALVVGAGGDGRQAPGARRRVFDAVVAQYVITTVPDPEATLDEFARVVQTRAARSSWSTTSARRPEHAPRLRNGSRGRRAISAGVRNSRGSGSRVGGAPAPTWNCWSGAPCRPSACSRLYAWARRVSFRCPRASRQSKSAYSQADPVRRRCLGSVSPLYRRAQLVAGGHPGSGSMAARRNRSPDAADGGVAQLVRAAES